MARALAPAQIDVSADLIRAAGVKVTRGRVRVLDAFGLALKAVDTRGVFRFSAAGAQRQHANHVHFRCTDCGGVFCLKAEPPPPPRLPRGFRLNEVAFDLRGTCAGCSLREGA